MKRRFDKLEFVKINIFVLQSTMLGRLKDRWKVGRKYLQTPHLEKALCQEYRKDSQKLALEEQSN